MDISILIVYYKTPDYTLNCVKSILKHKTTKSVEIVLIDNNSEDNPKQLLAPYMGQITYIDCNYNYGFATAMNIGYKHSTGQFVMAFNPDAELEPNAIDVVVDYMSANKDCGILAPLSRTSEGILEAPYSTLKCFNASYFWRTITKKSYKNILPTKLENVPWVFGTGITLNRIDITDNQLFEENTFLFWEEYYLAKSIKNKGKKIIIHPDFKITHHTSVSFKFNKEKLRLTALLSLSHETIVKDKEYGVLKSRFNLFFRMIDTCLMLLLTLALQLIKGENDYFKLEIHKLKSHFSIFIQNIFMTKNKSKAIDTAVKFELNNKKNPVYPPIYKIV
jgi:GT2 family glycosyltransferase